MVVLDLFLLNLHKHEGRNNQSVLLSSLHVRGLQGGRKKKNKGEESIAPLTHHILNGDVRNGIDGLLYARIRPSGKHGGLRHMSPLLHCNQSVALLCLRSAVNVHLRMSTLMLLSVGPEVSLKTARSQCSAKSLMTAMAPLPRIQTPSKTLLWGASLGGAGGQGWSRVPSRSILVASVETQGRGETPCWDAFPSSLFPVKVATPVGCTFGVPPASGVEDAGITVTSCKRVQDSRHNR